MYEWKNIIYSLSCPITNDVVYIGRTTRPDERYLAHISMAKTGRCKNRKMGDWILSLFDKGLKPIFTILLECERHELATYEKKFIHEYLPTGKLFNKDLMLNLHDQIDYRRLHAIVREKKVKYKKIAQDLHFGHYSVAGYLIGQTCELSLTKAKQLEAYILALQ